MIAPNTDKTVEEPGVDIVPVTDRFFAENGGLQSAAGKAGFVHEHRPQQAAMARAVAEALNEPGHLIVEAGTGVGKSFAYLVPFIHAATMKKQQVLVSTYTISLQEQLIYKDIPFLRKYMAVPFKAVLVKGRSNYLCWRRFSRAFVMGDDLLIKGQMEQLQQIRAWMERGGEGSLQDMSVQPSTHLWAQICCEHGNCLGQKCKEKERCVFARARKNIYDAHVLVVNHHLCFSELAMRLQGGAFLPRYAAVVFDEAHQVEQVAGAHFGIRLSQYAFEYWMRRLHNPEGNKGLLAAIRDGKTANEVSRLWDEVKEFFARVEQEVRLEATESQRTLLEPLPVESGLSDRMGQLCRMLKETAVRESREDMQVELDSIRLHGEEMRKSLNAFMAQSMEDHVYWVERQGRRKQLVLYSAPIEVAPILSDILYASVPSVVMTSATLSVGRDLEYFKKRIGATRAESLCTGSPFDFARQMRIQIPRDMPDPNDEQRFPTESARAILYFVKQSMGRAFVLFTSAKLMQKVAALVQDDLQADGYTLLVQGTGTSRHTMLEQFRLPGRNVLFGLDSFWMGVDVRGEALSNVIITRLPFAVPNQPLTQARMQRIRDKGGDPFKEYSMPEAILKFRQGVGRLIRTATDEGVVVILDRRVVDKWYGKLFLQSLPECPVEIVSYE
ncbi:MAG: DEAD/DEAH box helicase [Spartobacteria bacterium]|nr:DEAD/DEAH box helicase [Spartobacteria bacterium]